MPYIKLLISLLITFTVVFIFSRFNPTIETITYFPLDEDMSFQYAETSLHTCSDNEHKLCWTIDSTSDQALYLRQDIGLLFVNGKLYAISSKWKEDTQQIISQKSLSISPASYLQAISFHYGEIHHEDDRITSVQIMSDTDAFISKQRKNKKKDGHALRLASQTELEAVWERWIKENNINKENYELIPLINLSKYNESPLPSFTKAETAKIIGQLWEGLYKSYLIPLLEKIDEEEAGHMPLILLSHDKTHLLVLYEENKEVLSLYQKISPSANQPTITITSDEQKEK